MATLQAYLASSGAAGLASLKLANNSLGDEGAARLAGAWAGLQQLDLSECGVQQQVGPADKITVSVVLGCGAGLWCG
jgi:hypothetical protein